jgi:hypothetical protein
MQAPCWSRCTILRQGDAARSRSVTENGAGSCLGLDALLVSYFLTPCRLLGSNPGRTCNGKKALPLLQILFSCLALAARFSLESILPPSRVNAVAETVAALGKGYRAIGGSAQLVTDGWTVTRPERHFAPKALDSILGRFSTNRADKIRRHPSIEECPDLDVEFPNRAALAQPDSAVP